MNRNKHALWIMGALVLLISCTPTPKTGGELDAKSLVNGIYAGHYKGGPNAVDVRVTIQNKMIRDIKIVNHDALRGHKADPVIPQRIIDNQSTNVDAVTGATNSSHVIMNAVQNAVDKACKKGEHGL